jgi:ferredoxin
MAGTLLLERCNPYGAETGGPARVMAGLYGPGSAATPGMDLPDNVAQGEWLCPQQAQVRVYMLCGCGHRGRNMALCSWHDEIVDHAEFVGGVTRRVKDLIRVRGHYEEIQRRQCGACVRCMYPAGDGYDFAAEHKAIEAYQGELAYLYDIGAWNSAQARRQRDRIEAIVARFDEGIARGQIHRCPLRLIQVS